MKKPLHAWRRMLTYGLGIFNSHKNVCSCEACRDEVHFSRAREKEDVRRVIEEQLASEIRSWENHE